MKTVLFVCLNFLIILAAHATDEQKTMSAEPEVLRIGTFPALKLFELDMESLLNQAIENAGYKAEFINLPEERSRRMANTGKIDADLRRNYFGIEGYDNLLPLTTAWGADDAFLVVPSDKDCIEPQQLSKHKPAGLLGVGYFKWAYDLSEVGFEQTNTVDGLATMVIIGRADYSLLPERVIPLIFSRLEGKLKKCGDEPILSLPSYPVFHVKHSDKLDRISEELAKLLE